MKYCRSCNIEKDISDFGKCKTFADGRAYECKMCANKRAKRHSRTKKGVITAIYGHQKSRFASGARKVPPAYTKTWLSDWLTGQPLFHELYDRWVSSGYNRWEKPSVDRVDILGEYTIDNIELVTWRENFKRAREASKLGIISSDRVLKPVIKISMDGERIREYASLNMAARELGISRGNISQVCTGKRKSASGFRWEYK